MEPNKGGFDSRITLTPRGRTHGTEDNVRCCQFPFERLWQGESGFIGEVSWSEFKGDTGDFDRGGRSLEVEMLVRKRRVIFCRFQLGANRESWLPTCAEKRSKSPAAKRRSTDPGRTFSNLKKSTPDILCQAFRQIRQTSITSRISRRDLGSTQPIANDGTT